MSVLCGFVAPATMLVASATLSSRVRVWVEPQPLPGFNVPMTPFFEDHWFSWWGWRRQQHRFGEEAHLAHLPRFGQRLDRTVQSRHVAFAPALRFTFGRDLGRIAETCGSWWAVWLLWRLLVGLRIRRAAKSEIDDVNGFRIARRFSLILMGGFGLVIAAAVCVELIIRLAVPDYGLGAGIQWHAFRDWAPWTALLPAVSLWAFSRHGPPTLGPLLRLPVLVIAGAALTYSASRIARAMAELRAAINTRVMESQAEHHGRAQ